MSPKFLQCVVWVVLCFGLGGCSLHHRMDGEEVTGAVCGGIQGLPCPEGQLCDLPAGECQSADLQGTCVERPGACTREYDPVCGCDGMTYGNDCERLVAGVQKDHDGECEKAAGGADDPPAAR